MTRRTYDFEGRIARTIAESESWWPSRRGNGAKRPNVVVILMDDMGFSDISSFGSEIPTPAIDELAERGTRLTNFHVTPMCSPTRASLLTGLNHHRAGFAFVSNSDPGVPNRRCAFPPDAMTMPEILRENGYATFAIGKWHLAPEQEMHDAADREMWPCQVGFDRFYGFLEAFTTAHQPARLISDNAAIDTETYPDDYYVTDDLTDRAIEMIASCRANDPDKPFFLYFGHAAVHTPLQAKKKDIERFAGVYEAGWDRIQDERVIRQKKLGLFPEGLQLGDRTQEPGLEIPAWDELDENQRARFAREMAVYAGMIASVDESTSRLVEMLREMDELDDTVFLFCSDNGAMAPGVLSIPKRPGVDETPVELPLDEIGGPRSRSSYARGWAMVSNTPFRLYKMTAHEGGVRSPLIVSAPGVQQGEIIHDYQHVTDLLPTVLQLTGCEVPDTWRNRDRLAFDGESFATSLTTPGAVGTRAGQHEELAGHRSYVRDGWKLVTRHLPRTSLASDRWELYRLIDDPGECNDLAAQYPELVDELSRAWEDAAAANAVFPMDDGSGLAALLHNPEDARFSRPVVLGPGTPTLERYRASLLVAGRSFNTTIDFHYQPGDEGILVAHGAQDGGYIVYVQDRALHLEVNNFGAMIGVSTGVLEEGEQSAVLDMVAGEGRVCTATLSSTGGSVMLGGIRSLGGFFTPIEGIDVGMDRRSPVSWEVYEAHGSYPYSGSLRRVTYVPGEYAPDSPALRLSEIRQMGMSFQ